MLNQLIEQLVNLADKIDDSHIDQLALIDKELEGIINDLKENKIPSATMRLNRLKRKLEIC